jgi:hypothetical protein
MAIEVTESGAMVITGGEIQVYRLLTLRHALEAETVGLRLTRGRSALAIVKAETGLKARTAKDMVPKYEEWLRAQGILQ